MTIQKHNNEAYGDQWKGLFYAYSLSMDLVMCTHVERNESKSMIDFTDCDERELMDNTRARRDSECGTNYYLIMSRKGNRSQLEMKQLEWKKSLQKEKNMSPLLKHITR